MTKLLTKGAQDLSIFKIYAPTMVASRSEDGSLRIEGIASSTVRDHHGDSLTLKALEKMAASARGMTIFMNHSYIVPGDVFGRVEKVKLERSGQIDDKSKQEIWDLRFGIKVAKSNKQALDTFEMIEGGTRLGLSIGAMVPEGGAVFSKEEGGRYIVDDVELVETSVVGVPANPRSWIDYAVKSLAGKFPEKLEKERASMREVLEAEGATTVEAQGLVDDPIDESADPGVTPAELPDDGDGEVAAGTEPTDVNDSASSDQEDPHGEDAKVPVNDNNVTASFTSNSSTLLDGMTVGGTQINGTVTTGTSSTYTPSTTLSRVTVWDGDKVVEVDTGRSKPKGTEDQSAQGDPENAGGPTTPGTVTAKSGEDEIELTGAIDVTLKSSRQVIASLSAQLKAARAETEEVREDLVAATELATKALEGTALILAQLQATPMGRKTGYVEAEKSFTTLRDDIYGPDFQKLLTKGSPTP